LLRPLPALLRSGQPASPGLIDARRRWQLSLHLVEWCPGHAAVAQGSSGSQVGSPLFRVGSPISTLGCILFVAPSLEVLAADVPQRLRRRDDGRRASDGGGAGVAGHPFGEPERADRWQGTGRS
jgi:hypothetical protein